MSLRAKLLSIFLLVAVVPLLALGGVEYARSLRALEAMMAAQNARVAERIATTLRSRAALLQSDLHLLAENADTQRWLAGRSDGTESREVERAADRFVREAWSRFGGAYGGIAYVDSAQRVLYRLGDGVSSGASASPVELLQPVSLVIRHERTGAALGAVVVRPSLAGILPLTELSTGFGEAGYGMVLDRGTGRFLYHPAPSLQGAEYAPLIAAAQWQVDAAVLERERGTFRYHAGDTLRVASFVSLASPPWTVVVSGAVDEFAGPFVAVRRWTLLLFLVVAVIATLVFSRLLRRTTRSLEELTTATAVVGSGNLTPSLPPAGHDEVGRLTTSFQTMVGEIRTMVTEIESSRQMAVLGQFAAQLSHEIRNPLTSIKLNLQKLDRQARDGRMPETATRPLEIALREVGRLENVVRGVLHLAREHPQGANVTSLHRVVDDAVEVVASQAEERGIAIERAYDANDDRVQVDPGQLKGALLNLMLNALDAMPDGGTLHLRSSSASGRVTLRVADTGAGIPDAMAPEVFRPFFTTKASGTGLGLPLAKRAIEDQGGTLTLAPARERSGAEFAIELPVASPG